MHPHHPAHPRPPHPSPAQGYLLQKIVACERRSVSCLCTEWCFDACCAASIQSVHACGTPDWVLEDHCTLRISLPAAVQLCDSCGRTQLQTARVEVEATLPHPFICGMNEPRSTVLLLPCIRLIRAECTCSGCFRVQLQISLEICLVHYEICRTGACRPECPQLPLYPPPCC